MKSDATMVCDYCNCTIGTNILCDRCDLHNAMAACRRAQEALATERAAREAAEAQNARLREAARHALHHLADVPCPEPLTCGPWQAGEECGKCNEVGEVMYRIKALLSDTDEGDDDS